MDDKRPNSSPTGRDIAGAWLLCVLIAVLALGLTSHLHGGMPAAATVTTDVSPCPPALGSVCQPSADAAGRGVAAVAGLHRVALPIKRPGEQHRRG